MITSNTSITSVTLIPMILIIAISVALMVDAVFGEPPARVHPVVAMGRYLRWAASFIPSSSPSRAFAGGMFAWVVGAVVIGCAAAALQYWLLLHLSPWVAALALGVVLKPLLAWRMLRSEVLAVEAALAESLDAGRARLSHLVSRDPAQLGSSGVRESAIESLAENLNDSVVAPLFWFLLLELPGAAIYRFANTADAMWGYLGLRNGRDWTWAGKFAARADDVLSWAPARITALALCTWRGGMWSAIRVEARRTPSPNSGWPMAAMALRLGVALRKPGAYVLNAAGRETEPADTVRAIGIASRALAGLVAVTVLVLLVVLFWTLFPVATFAHESPMQVEHHPTPSISDAH